MSEIFKRKESDGSAEMLYISILDDFFPVRTFFTTKNGGKSTGVYKSLNMGVMSGDNPDIVAENRDLVFSSADCEIRAVAYPSQVHGKNIACIDSKMLDSGRDDGGGSVFRTLKFPDTDATVTNVPGVLLTSLHADCIPVWLYDTVKSAAGIAHAGWRGTRADIAAAAMRRMQEEFGSEPEDIIAVIGPGISRCCFETGSEVYESFKEMLPGCADDFSTYDGGGKYHIDLKEINRMLLERAGAGKIYISGLCTGCRSDMFYSYRRDGGTTGRMCAGMCLL